MDTALRIIITAILAGLIGSQISLDQPETANAAESTDVVAFARRPVEPATQPLVFEPATAEQVELFTAAVATFEAADLELPALAVRFDATGELCKGHAGLFRQGLPANITLCSELRHVVLHELAHAWEWHTLDDTARNDFVADHGLETWNSTDIAWGDRGIEQFADTVAIGFVLRSGSDNPNVIAKLCSFERITGIDHPAVTEEDCSQWSERHTVANIDDKIRPGCPRTPH